MGKAFNRAWNLIISGDAELWEIIGRTLEMSLLSSLISLAIGAIIGFLIAVNDFPGKKVLIRIIRTLMGLPPVLAGLIVFIVLSGTGPLGKYRLIFTVTAMVIAQVMLITPIIAGMTESYASGIAGVINENAKGIRLNKFKVLLLTVNESKFQLISIYLMGFSRAIAEVGAVSLAGGSIAHKTEVMTTAIMDYTNMGNFGYALGLGLILLVISLTVNGLVTFGQEFKGDRNLRFGKAFRKPRRIKYR